RPTGRGARTGWWVAGFPSGPVPSASGVASSLPPGLNATPVTPPLGPARPTWRGAPIGLPVAGFHSRTVPSPSALASIVPSALNATPLTPPLGPVSAWGGARTGGAGRGFPRRARPGRAARASID